MEKKPNVKINFLYSISYQVLLLVAPLVVSPYISHVLGSENIGIYAYVYSMAQYFAAFCTLGISHHGNRTIAVCRDDPQKRSKTFWEFAVLKFLISTVVLFAYIIYGIFIADPQYRLYTFLEVFFILSVMFDLHWFFAGLEEFKITVTRMFIIKLLSIICIFLFVKKESDLALYTLIMSGSSLISEVYLWIKLRGRVTWVKPRLKDILHHLKPVLILFIPILAMDLYRMMDKIMLGEMISMDSVGQYENADKIVKICIGVVCAIGSVMLPRMAKLNAENDTAMMRKYLGNSMKVTLCMSCAFVAGIIAVGKPFAPMFFGEEFVECGYVLQLLAVSVLIIGWSNLIRTQYLIACNKDRIYIIAVWIGVVVNLLLNILLIPRLQAIGAALATVITELVVCIIQTVWAWKALPIGVFFKNLLVYSGIGAIMFVVVKAVELLPIGNAILLLVIQVAVGAVVYISLAAIYLWLTDRELFCSAGQAIKRVLKKLHLAR